MTTWWTITKALLMKDLIDIGIGLGFFLALIAIVITVSIVKDWRGRAKS